jgi:hypothetical protein
MVIARCRTEVVETDQMNSLCKLFNIITLFTFASGTGNPRQRKAEEHCVLSLLRNEVIQITVKTLFQMNDLNS